jgi:hypothetical protein
MITRIVTAVLALAVVCSTQPGCVPSHRPLQGSMERLLAGRLPSPVRVTRLNGTQVLLYEPQVNRDTLMGWNDAPTSTRPGPRFLERVAVADIRELSREGTNVLASAGVVLLVLAALVAIGLASYPVHGGI